ncbi:hypothetical protein RND81_07G027300 [Saponaria officinalis]|uniref:NAC domain-containing protein n=1 Tax=Saponaria officinalis TaxID=3572 RepID=A0AAW1JLQ2_SAPOF
MAKSWLLDYRGIAKKVRHASLSPAVQIADCGAKLECPKCHHWIGNSDVSYEWPGFPAGVKFDPSDVELLEHLAAKCGRNDAKPHVFIDEFIPTIETDKGICYTHPKDLPGVSKDGNSVHFFHKTANAYASGQRKRRKIQNEQNHETVRWHKTGKTKPVFDNCIQKGCKKIMVLYRSSHKGSKPVKSNWVMHQYHLGIEEDERDGEYVVSKIFYQQNKQNEALDDGISEKESVPVVIPHCPKTPTPNPHRSESFLFSDDATDDCITGFNNEDPEPAKTEYCNPPSSLHHKEDIKPEACPAEESQALDSNINDVDLRCNEIFSSCVPLDDNIFHGLNDIDDNGSYDITGLENIELDSSDLQDIQFGSQDSILSWLDKLY